MRRSARLTRSAAGAALVLMLAGCGLMGDDEVTVEDTYGLQMADSSGAGEETTTVPGAPTTAAPAPTTAPAATTTTVAPEEVARLRERFVEAGNDLCSEEYAQTERQMRVDPGSSVAAAFAFFRDARDMLRRIQTGLRRLGVPPGDEATVDWLTASIDPLLALLDPVLRRGGFASQAELDTFTTTWEPLLANFDATAAGYGLTECTSTTG